jgi:hypothetical protein
VRQSLVQCHVDILFPAGARPAFRTLNTAPTLNTAVFLLKPLAPMRTESPWISIRSKLPDSEALVWTSGRFAVASLFTRPDGSRAFMETHTDCVLEWPSHWMPLPQPPVPEAD